MKLLITTQFLDEHFADWGLAQTPCVNDSDRYYWDVTQVESVTLKEFTDSLKAEQLPFKLIQVVA